jgi:hypothetical protein
MAGLTKARAVPIEYTLGQMVKLSLAGWIAPRLLDEIIAAAEETMRVVGNAKTPVDTGYLQSMNEYAAHLSGGEIVLEVLNETFYAEFICLGHATRSGSLVAGRDWMTPALDAGERVILDRIDRLSLADILLAA